MQAISNREPKWLCTYVVFFFHDSATTEIYTYGHTLSLHDALPISLRAVGGASRPGYRGRRRPGGCLHRDRPAARRTRALEPAPRSEEHTSELQSLMRISYAVFCLKKKRQARQGQHGTAKTLQDHHTYETATGGKTQTKTIVN